MDRKLLSDSDGARAIQGVAQLIELCLPSTEARIALGEIAGRERWRRNIRNAKVTSDIGMNPNTEVQQIGIRIGKSPMNTKSVEMELLSKIGLGCFGGGFVGITRDIQ